MSTSMVFNPQFSLYSNTSHSGNNNIRRLSKLSTMDPYIKTEDPLINESEIQTPLAERRQSNTADPDPVPFGLRKSTSSNPRVTVTSWEPSPTLFHDRYNSFSSYNNDNNTTAGITGTRSGSFGGLEPPSAVSSNFFDTEPRVKTEPAADLSDLESIIDFLAEESASTTTNNNNNNSVNNNINSDDGSYAQTGNGQDQFLLSIGASAASPNFQLQQQSSFIQPQQQQFQQQPFKAQQDVMDSYLNYNLIEETPATLNVINDARSRASSVQSIPSIQYSNHDSDDCSSYISSHPGTPFELEHRSNSLSVHPVRTNDTFLSADQFDDTNSSYLSDSSAPTRSHSRQSLNSVDLSQDEILHISNCINSSNRGSITYSREGSMSMSMACEPPHSPSASGHTHYSHQRNTSISSAGSLNSISNEDKRFKCAQCDASFTRKSRLNEHIRKVHEGRRKNYTCDKCSKHLSSRENLNRHKVIHTDKYKCPSCGKRHDRSDRFHRHVIKCKAKRAAQAAMAAAVTATSTYSALQQQQQQQHQSSAASSNYGPVSVLHPIGNTSNMATNNTSGSNAASHSTSTSSAI
ncbi:unnamed protein product [Ambrosiozyma monospora]|uniref:Unnamed protein product n=1 Tax=Ambrosiozyma monospora TaxID=43982 RepID=A0ACB5SRH3_AMBMO|nr:unnamed protein product [Ambrosiozyma monospora]